MKLRYSQISAAALAKGTLLVALGDGTFAALPPSVNESAALVTDSTTDTGLRWDGGTPPVTNLYDSAVYDSAVYG